MLTLTEGIQVQVQSCTLALQIFLRWPYKYKSEICTCKANVRR